MAMTADKVNRLAMVLVDTLSEYRDDVPESHAVIAAEGLGLQFQEAMTAINIMIEGKLLKREQGPVLVPGDKFEDIKMMLDKWKAKNGVPA